MSKEQLQKAIQQCKRQMEKAAKALDFLEAANHRDDMYALEKMFKEKYL